MSEENKSLIRRYGEEVMNKGDLAAADRMVATHYSGHLSALPEATGLEGLKQVVSLFRTAFPDGRFTLEDIIAEGDKVVARWTFRGTHEGLLMGIPPTGKSIHMTATVIYRIRNAKIEEIWGDIDMLGVARQIGVVSPPPFSSSPPSD